MRRRSKIKELEKEIETLRRNNDDLRKIINGEKHKTGVHCIGCANLVEIEKTTSFLEVYNVKYCKLDFNCKDRVENR